MAKRIFTDESLQAFVDKTKLYVDNVADNKADTSHSHTISDISNLQSTLDGKAATSHGTHVSYSTTTPVMDGTAAVGAATTVARSDHKHPTDTTRASQQSLDSHTSNTTTHITSSERANWGIGYTHSQSVHAPSNAEKNQNAFSNIKVGDVTIAADTTTDTVTFVAGNNITLTPDATNDKITISAKDTTYTLGSFGITATAAEINKLDGVTATATEINYIDGVTSNIQTQLDGKAAKSHTHKVTDISDLTATATELNYMDGVTSNVQTQLDGKAASGHTHNYAGSSSAGGAATSANKLNTNNGSATQPVYFANGVPVATTYTLEKSVPSNAVFTDTHYASKNVVGATNATSNTATVLANGNVYINSVENGAVTSSHKISGSGATTVTTDDKGNIVISSADNNTTYDAAGSSLGLVKTGGDVTISNGVITVNDDSHNHTVANVDNLQAALDGKQATVTGGATTITSSNLTANRALISNGSGKVAVSAVTSTELGYLDGVTSNVQTQLDGKAASSHNHAASNITSGTLSSDRLPTVPIAKGGTGATTAAGALTNLGITATASELNYVDGATSNIQTQLNGKAASTHTHSYLPLSGGTITGLLDADKVFRNGNTFYNVLEFASTATVDEIVIKTKIPFISGNSMPLVHLKGYAYGESATIEMTVAFYIYGDKFTNMGVVSSCPWKPTVYLSSYTENNTKYIAISFSGSIYYPRFVVDYTDIWSGSSNRDYSSGWASANRIGGETTSIIPSADKVTVPYKAIANDINGNSTTATNVAWSGITSKPSYYDAKAIKGITRSGTTFTYTCMDGTTGTFTQQDNNTDTKVTNTLATTTKAYVTGTTSATTNTSTQVFDTGVYLDTMAGQLTAATFNGTTFSGSGIATVSEVETYLGI